MLVQRTIAPAPNGFTYPGDYQPRLSEGVRPSIEGPDPMTDHASHTNGNGASGEQYNTMAPEFMHVESPKRFDEGPEE